MTKYFLKGTDKAVNIGDNILVIKEGARTPFGKGEYRVKVQVSEENLDRLVKEGILETKDVIDTEAGLKQVDQCLDTLVKMTGMPHFVAADLMVKLGHVSLAAFIEVLLECMAEHENEGHDMGEIKGFFLNPVNNFAVEPVTGAGLCVVRFATEEGAKKAFDFLLPFIQVLMDERE